MAIYHLNSKVISRSKGQTAGNALAYETGQKLRAMDGQEKDFTSKIVYGSEMIGFDGTLQELADKMEFAETRKNSTVGRRMTLALPEELNPAERMATAKEFGQFMHDEYGLAVVVSVHPPDRGGDERNHHAHLTMSDRRISPEGEFTEKARELTARENGQAKKELAKIREKWADVANNALERAGHSERIDHRSNQDRKILARPGEHLGKAKTEISRKTGYFITKAGANQLIKEDNGQLLRKKAERRIQEDREIQSRRDRGDERGLEQGQEGSQGGEEDTGRKQAAERVAGNRESRRKEIRGRLSEGIDKLRNDIERTLR